MNKLTLRFKGNREYIHGPDIFNSMYNIAENQLNCNLLYAKLASRKLATRQLVYTEQKIEKQPYLSVFKASSIKKQVVYYLYELDERIKNNIDYNEYDIVKNANFIISKKKSEIKNYLKYTVCEISVALLKELCNVCITDSVKWIFVEFEALNPISLYTKEKLAIIITKNIGTKMIVADVYISEKKVGIIKFSSI